MNKSHLTIENRIKLRVFFLMFLAFLLTNCTEKIDTDLNSSSPQIVVEGNISIDEPAIIKLTESVNFDENNIFPKGEGALIRISDNTGNTEILTETEPGTYKSYILTGKIGYTYSISFETDNKILTSNSTIPNQINFDSLIVKKSSLSGGFGNPGATNSYEVIVKYSDPIDENNYYRFVEIVNGEFSNDHVFDDRLINGLEVENTLKSFKRELSQGDTLKIIMQCIDKNVYEYFNSFSNLSGGPMNSSTPANPYTNIEGGILGYFSAHTSQEHECIIQ